MTMMMMILRVSSINSFLFLRGGGSPRLEPGQRAGRFLGSLALTGARRPKPRHLNLWGNPLKSIFSGKKKRILEDLFFLQF